MAFNIKGELKKEQTVEYPRPLTDPMQVIELSNQDIAIACQTKVLIADPITFKKKKILSNDNGRIDALCEHPGGFLIGGSEDYSVAIWDIRNAYCFVRKMSASQEIYNLVSWDKVLFSSGGGSVSKVILWHATNFSVLSET